MAEDIVTPINDRAADISERRRMHHLAGDEILEEVLGLLAFMELCGEHRDGDNFSMHGEAVKHMAANIVRRVIEARKHYRETL